MTAAAGASAGGSTPGRGGGVDTYRSAIDATTATLAMRALLYRILILVVFTGIVASFVWALIARSWAPLLLLVLVIASVGAFFYVDALRLNRWRARLLQPWQRRELDFTALGAAMRAIPGLPRETIAGMLMSLPQAADLGEEQQWSSAAREQMAAALVVRDRRRAAAVLLKTLGVLAAGAVVGLVVW